GAPCGFNMTKRIGANRGISRHDTCRKMYGDAGRGCRIVIVGDLVVATTTVNKVVAGTAFICLISAKCIVAAKQRVVESRSPDRGDMRDGVGTDIGHVTGRGTLRRARR